MTEIATKQETTLEKQAKMRERAKYLRDQRETERLALVEGKLEQRWREQCEEMRGLLSKKQRDEVFTERACQLKLNAGKREREKQGNNCNIASTGIPYSSSEAKMYAKLWQEDIETKSKREEMEEAMKIEKSRQMLKVSIDLMYLSVCMHAYIIQVLTLQTAALEKQREELSKLKEQEACHLV